MKNQIKSILILAAILLISISSFGQEESGKVKTESFEVDGVCGMCKDRIENAALIKGVKLATWDNETHMLKVVYKPSKVAIQEIHEAVAEAGHETKKAKANMDAYNKLPECCKYKDGAVKH